MHYISDNVADYHKSDLDNYLGIDPETELPDVYDSYILMNIEQLEPAGTYLITKEHHAPDFISKEIYGDERYWWILLLYNGFRSPYEIKSGMVIKYFTMDSFSWLFYDLIQRENMKQIRGN